MNSSPNLLSPLLGRDSERARIQALLDGAREASSAALLLVGDAGVGKSALLAEARERAGDMCVLCCGGVESEAALPFAALHQLLRPLLDRLDALPRPQASALLRALGIQPGGAERFLVSAAVLSLLDDAAEDGPVLCLIDDAHWLDDASAEILQFVARRLHAEGIAMLFAARDDAGLPCVPRLKLDGLDPDAAARLLDRHAELAPHVRDRLVAITAGNPLALLELSAGLSSAQRIGAESLLGPLPVSAGVERAFLLRVRRLPQDTQAMLLVAAADDSGDLATVLAAAEQLGAPAAALDPAEADGLILLDGARLQLRHPLVRSAIYHGAPLSRRRAAHAALAGALSGDAHADRRAWHRVAASAGADPAVVEELEHAARRAHSRGAYAAASLAYERAASLTSDDERQARQLTAAAGAAWPLGDIERTHSLLRRARPLTADPLLQADIARLSGMVELIQGVPATAWQSLVRAAEEVRPLDPDRALALLTIASLAATYACDDAAVERIAAAAGRLPARDTAVARFLTTRLRGVGAHYARDFPRAVPDLRAALRIAERADDAELTELVVIVGSAGLFLGDDHAVHAMHHRMVQRARDSGALSLLTHSLPRLALSDIWAGHWAAASARLAEALELARLTRQHQVVAYLLSVQALVAALRGEEAACRSLIDESLELAAARRLGHVRFLATSASIMLAVGLGDCEDALERAKRLSATAGYDHWCPMDKIEAALRAGDHDTGARWLAAFAPWAEHTAAPWARAVVEHCRALLAPDEQAAEAHFRASLALHDTAARPFGRARTELAFGEFLRRARRRVDAREHLRAALDGCEALGATLWAERARVELRASGQTARRRDPSTLDDLTPQELQIAQFVACGRTNRDVAAQLFLSPRTIDFHLRNVFRKLGISSRTELAALRL